MLVATLAELLAVPESPAWTAVPVSVMLPGFTLTTVRAALRLAA